MRMYSFFMRWCCLDVEFQASVFDEVQVDFDLGIGLALGRGARFETFAWIVLLERYRNVDRGIVEQLAQALGIKPGILGIFDFIGLRVAIDFDVEFQDRRGGRAVLGYGFQFGLEVQGYGQFAGDLPGEVERIFRTAGPSGSRLSAIMSTTSSLMSTRPIF